MATATRQQRQAGTATNRFTVAPAMTPQQLQRDTVENFNASRFQRAANDYATKYALVLLGTDPNKATHWGVRSAEGKTYLPNGEGCLCADCQNNVKRRNDDLERAGFRRFARCKHGWCRDFLLRDLWADEEANGVEVFHA